MLIFESWFRGECFQSFKDFYNEISYCANCESGKTSPVKKVFCWAAAFVVQTLVCVSASFSEASSLQAAVLRELQLPSPLSCFPIM